MSTKKETTRRTAGPQPDRKRRQDRLARLMRVRQMLDHDPGLTAADLINDENWMASSMRESLQLLAAADVIEAQGRWGSLTEALEELGRS
jgi:hypothetical protein